MTMTAPAVATIARRDFAADYADFSANLRIESMPPQVIEAVKTDIFDTLACAMAGIRRRVATSSTSRWTGAASQRLRAGAAHGCRHPRPG